MPETLESRRALAAEVRAALRPGRLFVGGEWVDARDPERLTVANPATGEALTTVARAGAEDVERAVAAARAALAGPWGRTDARERGRLLRRLAERIDAERDRLACLESLQNGKTVTEAHQGDLPPAIEVFEYFAGWADKLHGEVIPVSGPYLNYTRREPVGVVGAIVPWNYPLMLASWKLAPALATGNAVVLKPDEKTPLTALRLAELALEAGFPPGVLNVVTGDGQTTGAALTRSDGVDKVAFTGSVDTARAILRAAADSNLKRVSLELGGKSPNIVFADADLDRALQAAMWGIFANKGEVCSAGSRLLVERSLHDELVEKLTAKAAALRVGDPLDPASRVGSVVSPAQLERIEGYVAEGKAGGGQVRCGGARVTEGDLAKGLFYPPTIFTGVDPGDRIAREEVFGPVLVVLPFEDEAGCVELANASRYGLVSAVWTRDIGRAHALAARIQAGSVWINDYNCFDSASPFGGYKQSGWGRDLSVHALESYTQTKSVWVRLDR